MTIPEGLRVVDTVDVLAKNTDFSRGDFEKVLEQPDKLGLPAYADGQPRGLPLPGDLRPGPEDHGQVACSRAWSSAGKQAAEEADLSGAADRLGYTAGRADDDREPGRGRGPRRGHAEGRPGDLQPARRPDRADHRQAADRRDRQLRARPQARRGADDRRRSRSTRPTTPTSTPASRRDRSRRPAMDAHRRPRPTLPTATGSSTSPSTCATGKTKFTADYDEFLRFKDEFKEYCETSEAC